MNTPGLRDLPPLPQYACGLCGAGFGSNCSPGDISCVECDARLCPHCGRWFSEEEDGTPGGMLITREALLEAVTRITIPEMPLPVDGKILISAESMRDALWQALEEEMGAP